MGNVDLNEPSDDGLIMIGWREWLALPQLGIPAIKAKIDTGARTSAIHAENMERYRRNGQDRVRFDVLPVQRTDRVRISCDARVIDQREVTDSGGHQESRMVILTRLHLERHDREIELTLTSRPTMLFRMLLGRTSMVPEMAVNPSRSFVSGRPDLNALYPALRDGDT